MALDDLAVALAARPPVLIADPTLAQAAVALVLVDSPARFLLVERARFAGDPWSGHLALPGGRRAATDPNLRATAERETREEVGVDLARASFLGRHDDLHGTVQPIVVATFVYRLDAPPALSPNPELKAAEWCALERLYDPARQDTLTIEWRGRPVALPAVRVLDDPQRPVLWGLTYRLLETLFARTARPLPVASPAPPKGEGMTAQRFALPIPGGKLTGDVRGTGPALVFLHGFTLDRSAWDLVVDALAATHTVVRVDLRGHGASSDAVAPYLACDDVLVLLDGLGLSRAALVGLSWGGQVALDVALAHPARVTALALVDSTLLGHAWSAAWRDMVARLRALATGPAGPGAAGAEWFASPLFAPARERPALRERLAAWDPVRAGHLWAGRNGGVPLAPAAHGRLGELAVPALVVVGERDEPDFLAIARTLHHEIAGSRLVVLPGVGHLPPLEAPAALVAALAAFLAAAGA